MIKKTRDYSMFKFRNDNREGGVKQDHLEELKASIRINNLLDMCPILVNGKMEVINGQHRLRAAQDLGLEIYYEMNNDLNPIDIVLMNTSKQWQLNDFSNFYVTNHYPEYLKLSDFIKKHGIGLKIVLQITMGATREKIHDFKHGKYIFTEESFGNKIDWCKDTISLIKKLNGSSPYTSTSRFWKPLVRLMRDESFNMEKWIENIRTLSEKFHARATASGYTKMIMDVYNWHNRNKIDISGEDEFKNRVIDKE